MTVSYNSDRNKFPLRLHKWKTFVFSFHNSHFSYSGHCLCCNLDFNGKKMPYEILSGLVAEHVSKTDLTETTKYVKMQHIFPQSLRKK
jgi:hypothetical protein